MSWEASPFNPVLRASPDDYKLAHQHFTEEEKKQIGELNESNNINNADVSLIEYNGKVLIHYFTGNQSASTPCTLAEAIYNGTKTQFLQGWFPEHKENK